MLVHHLSLFLVRQRVVSWRPRFSPNYLWWLRDNEGGEEEENLMRMRRIYKIMRMLRVMRMIRLMKEEEKEAYVINPQRRTDCFHTHITSESTCHHRGSGVGVHKLPLVPCSRATWHPYRPTFQLFWSTTRTDFFTVLVKMLTVFLRMMRMKVMVGGWRRLWWQWGWHWCLWGWRWWCRCSSLPLRKQTPCFSHQWDNKYRQRSQKQTLPVWTWFRTSLLGHKCWLSIILILFANLFCLLVWKSLLAHWWEVFADLK